MHPWRKQFLRTARVVLIGLFVIHLWVFVVDPFDTIFFSPPFDRAPVVTNQRYSYPALARKERFDSLVLGTSTSRLLRPERLDELFEARFANLAMNSATAYEQFRIAEVFVRRHPSPRVVIIGLDPSIYCARPGEYSLLTPRPFPEWMYDEDPWNDLWHHYSAWVLEQTAKQFLHITGIRRSRNGADGYTNFMAEWRPFDLDLTRRLIYGRSEPRPIEPVDPPVEIGTETRRQWEFPTHRFLDATLDLLPTETRKVLYFVPIHAYAQPRVGSMEWARIEECKTRVAALAAAHRNSVVLDFHFPSRMTRNDHNYRDSLHYDLPVAERVMNLIAEGSRGSGAHTNPYRVLHHTPAE